MVFEHLKQFNSLYRNFGGLFIVTIFNLFLWFCSKHSKCPIVLVCGFLFSINFLRIAQLYWCLRLCTLLHPFYAWCCCIFLRILMYVIAQIWNLFFLGTTYHWAREELYWIYSSVSETVDHLHRRVWVLQENSSISSLFQIMY